MGRRVRGVEAVAVNPVRASRPLLYKLFANTRSVQALPEHASTVDGIADDTATRLGVRVDAGGRRAIRSVVADTKHGIYCLARKLGAHAPGRVHCADNQRLSRGRGGRLRPSPMATMAPIPTAAPTPKKRPSADRFERSLALRPADGSARPEGRSRQLSTVGCSRLCVGFSQASVVDLQRLDVGLQRLHTRSERSNLCQHLIVHAGPPS